MTRMAELVVIMRGLTAAPDIVGDWLAVLGCE